MKLWKGRSLVKQQVFNPYLPSWEYIPDGEPHVFGDRVYVYGSHDRFGAPIFCMNDYVCWSAPVEDLSQWRCEGTIFRKNQDPKNKLGLHLLFAPDVARGPDGRYYLYYAFDFYGMIGVAVCDTPAGRYEFYGYVHYADGTIWGRRKGDQMPFDPAVLVDDDGSVYLYSGFYTPVPALASGFRKLKNDGGVVVGLEQDMVTIRTEPKVIFPKEGPGAFADHEFFEASSIRKDGSRYIFVYSSRHNHELCYAVSDRPDGGFVYGGTLVSLGDLFLDGNEDETRAVNYLGNTHGGMLHLGDRWYIFYHRQTNRHSYSRQACAEELTRNPDGSFRQAEVTSCGLNGGPLKGVGRYEARIACNLWGKEGTCRYDDKKARKALKHHPYLTQTGGDREGDGDQYIANMGDGAVVGFKYFEMEGPTDLELEVKGNASGTMEVSTTPDFASPARIVVHCHGPVERVRDQVDLGTGKKALYFRFCGTGAVDFLAFTLRHA